MTVPHRQQTGFPSLAGALYAIGGGVAGLLAFVPAAVLASLMMGCGGDSGTCEATGSGLVGILVAIAAFAIPLAGGFVSALRGGEAGFTIGIIAGFALVAAEWIFVLGLAG